MSSVKSVHFAPGSDPPTRLDPPPRDGTPALIVYGRLQHDLKLLTAEVKALPRSEVDYHGSLQVLLSAMCRMEASLRRLIQQFQEGQ